MIILLLGAFPGPSSGGKCWAVKASWAFLQAQDPLEVCSFIFLHNAIDVYTVHSAFIIFTRQRFSFQLHPVFVFVLFLFMFLQNWICVCCQPQRWYRWLLRRRSWILPAPELHRRRIWCTPGCDVYDLSMYTTHKSHPRQKVSSPLESLCAWRDYCFIWPGYILQLDTSFLIRWQNRILPLLLAFKK